MAEERKIRVQEEAERMRRAGKEGWRGEGLTVALNG